ncbi:MAG TPA: ricin-type beta-trefoil lectin domain protein [Actinocrinis sp.]|uniref:ricin-type beta-trefoil lectin domain protein n=1 Tax=Actinocrinis sp. TaxID=1920516 RepID=UPI002DDD3BCC|nr:ricin-type beta-trefoil lectin domain protein [Actinocrinis sp.]HEV2347408.1 ricin-type beta-trefoil lectin domain protein [Actinocrinis sp.]
MFGQRRGRAVPTHSASSARFHSPASPSDDSAALPAARVRTHHRRGPAGQAPRIPLSSRRFRLLTLSVVAALGGLFTFGVGPAQASLPGVPSGWTQVFADDFNGGAGSGIDGQWMYDTGPGSSFGTGEIETMTNSTGNVHLDGNGNLDITALNNGGWTSGRVQTTSANVGAPAGGKLEVTASIDQPSGGVGYWPAFWMLGPGQWPENGEIDIMEDVNSLSEVSGTIHCGTYPGGPCNEGNGIGSGLRACGGCQSGFHTYTMILDRTNTSAESITFYLDGSSYFTVTEGQVGTSTWQQAFDHNLSIILDLAMGGGYPNGVCGCTSPTGSTASGGTMQVDYVAAYTTNGGGPPPPPPGSGPVTLAYNGLCLDVRGANSANFTPVQVYTCNGTNAQQWTFVQAGTTLHALGKCLDINGGGTANGTTVDLYDCNNTAAQVFIPQSNGSLYNPQSNKCLDDTGWGGSGTQSEIWDCTGNTNQKWNLP